MGKLKESRLLLNRLRPMARAAGSLQRSNLLEKLRSREGAHLIVIHGPAGYGKTSLLTQYFHDLRGRDCHCGWLSLDLACQDPVQLLAHLVASLDATSVMPQQVADAAFNGFHGMDEAEALNLVVNSLSAVDTAVYLLIDDVHHLSQDKSKQVIASLVQLTGANTRIVITSREFPTQLMSRDQLARTLVEISIPDLAFSEVEARSVLSLSPEVNESDTLARAIYKKTEGWPAALEFARLWVKKQGKVDLSTFVNQSSDFVSFLMHEVFNILPVSLQEVVLSTSILTEFNGDLINAMCERRDGWTVLEQLLQKNLALAVDHSNSQFRYHNILNEFLKDRFAKYWQDRSPGLNARAARWYIDNHKPAEALRHAVDSGQSQLILAAIECAGGWRLVLDGRIATLRSILSTVDAADTQEHPRALLGYIMLEAKAGRITEANSLYDKFAEKTDAFRVFAGKSLDADFAIEAQIVGSYLAIVSDRHTSPKYISELRRILQLLRKDDHFLRAIVTNFLCTAYFDSTNYERAFKLGEVAIDHYRAIRSIYGENFLYFHLGKICLAQGRLRDAEQLYEQGRKLARQNFGSDNNMVSIAAAHLAEVALEKNDVDGATKHLDIALARIEDFESWFDIYFSAYSASVNIAQANKDFLSARKALRRAASIGRRRGMTRLRLFAVCRYSRLLAHQGQLGKARWIVEALCISSKLRRTGSMSSRVADELAITIAYNDIRAGRPTDAVPVLLDRVSLAAKSNSRRTLMELYVLLAIAYLGAENEKAALERLNHACNFAIFEGFKRPFLQYGSELMPLLDIALSEKGGFPLNSLKRSFLVDIVKTLSQEKHSGAYQTSGALTRREREIVRYVSEGCTNKEIARHCCCTENTVKFHLKNVFGKLNIKNRRDLARAVLQDDHMREI